MKQGNAVKTGAEPGITRAVQSKVKVIHNYKTTTTIQVLMFVSNVKVNHNPLVYVYDTPGVLEPTFKDVETGFKLACLSNFHFGTQ